MSNRLGFPIIVSVVAAVFACGGTGSTPSSTTSSSPTGKGVTSGGSSQAGAPPASAADGGMGGSATGGNSPSGLPAGTTPPGGGGPTAPSAIPATCSASDQGNTALGHDVPDPTGTAVAAITYQNVGATGSYEKVVSMAPGTFPTCTDHAAACVKATKNVSGPLVPFDEEMTMVFSGPMDLYQVAVYSPGASGYSRVSYWDRCTSDNLVFMNNDGGGNVSGTWSICAGASQSYATANGETSAKAPTPFGGHLADGKAVNAITSNACNGQGDGSECGFYRDVGMHGWKGSSDGSKILIAKLRMPLGQVTPAYWILPAQVVRTAQYGCNCRGEGAAGGCGELDVAEVLGGNTATPAHPMQATSTFYSFQGATGGGGSYFQRPVMETATFVVVFDAPSRSIALRRLAATDFNFASNVAASVVSGWLNDVGVARPLP